MRWQQSAAVGLVGLAALAGVAPLAAQQDGGSPALQVLPVQGNVYVIQGAGANIAAQVGPDGVVLADAGPAGSAEAVLAALRDLTRQPIRYIINTGPGADHVGGNQALAAAGRSLFDRGCCGNDVERARSNNGSASLVGPENLLLHMSQDGYPVVAWPTEVFIQGESKNLFLNDEPIQVFYQPAAHSDADSVVHFRRSDVVVTGEIFDMTRFPIIDLERGGTIQGEIDALNRMIQLVVPSIPLPYIEGGTKVIPARGRISEQAELVEYRDMVTIVRDRVQALIDDGRTLAEIQDANPANGFRGRFGADTGPWTTADFVEAVYRGLVGGA